MVFFIPLSEEILVWREVGCEWRVKVGLGKGILDGVDGLDGVGVRDADLVGSDSND